MINIVTKSGGNDFHGRYSEAYMVQPGDNLSDTPAALPKATLANPTIKGQYQMTRNYQLIADYAREITNGEADSQNTPFGAQPTASPNFALLAFEATQVFKWVPTRRKGEVKGTPTNSVLFDVQYGRNPALDALNVTNTNAPTAATYVSGAELRPRQRHPATRAPCASARRSTSEADAQGSARRLRHRPHLRLDEGASAVALGRDGFTCEH